MRQQGALVQPASPNDALIASWNFLDGSTGANYGGAPITFTRAGATATRVNASGVIEVVAANTPRFDYDPVTLAIRGLLIEEGRSNLARQSEALATTPWSFTNVVPTNAYASYRGLSFTRVTAANTGPMSQGVTFTGNGTKSMSLFVRQNAGAIGVMQCFIYDNTAGIPRGGASITVASDGTITATSYTGGGAGVILGVDNFGDGVYRIRVSVPNVIAANTNSVYTFDSGAATLTDVLIAGVQVENAPFPTSYIPTTTVSVVRNADDCSSLLSAVTGFSTAHGAAVVDFVPTAPLVTTNDQVILEIGSGGSADRLSMDRAGANGTAQFLTSTGGVSQANLFSSAMQPSAVGRLGVAWSASDFALVVNAGTPVTQASGTPPTAETTIFFGRYGGGGFQLNGWLRKFSLYNRRISNTELQTLTARPQSMVWDFDASRLSLDSAVASTYPATFGRVGATATRVNASGLIEIVAADAPRFDYDPVTLALKGLLIEEVRTNLLRYSGDLTQSTWTTGTGSTAAMSTLAAPDGFGFFSLVTANAGAGYHYIGGGSPGTLTTGVTYTSSVYVKQGTARYCTFGEFAASQWLIATFDFTTGTIVSTNNCTATATSVGGGVYRLTNTFTRVDTSGGGFSVGFGSNSGTTNQQNYTAAGTETGYAWGVQMEVGAFATSYIPTTSAAVARNADVCSLALSTMLEFNAAAFSLFVEAIASRVPPTAVYPWAVQINNDVGDAHGFFLSGPTTADVYFLGGNTQSGYLASITPGAVSKFAEACASTNYAAVVNGGTVGTLSNAEANAPVTKLALGQTTTNLQQFCGHIRKVQLYNYRLTNAALQALTT